MKQRGIKLQTINWFLGKVGLMLVISHHDGVGAWEPTRFWIQKKSSWRPVE